MKSLSEQLEDGRRAHLVANSIEQEARERVRDAFQSWANGSLDDNSIRYRLEDIVRSAYRSSSEIAREHVALQSGIPDWLPPAAPKSPEYLKSLIQDVRRNLRVYKKSQRTDKDLRRAVFRIGLSAGVAAQRGFTDASIHSADYLKKSGYTIRKVWIANFVDNSPCSECRRLHGTSVDLDENFPVPTKTLAVYKNLQGPPRHPNCRCYIVTSISLTEEKQPVNVDRPPESPPSMTTEDVKKMPESKFKAFLFSLRAIIRKFFRRG